MSIFFIELGIQYACHHVYEGENFHLPFDYQGKATVSIFPEIFDECKYC